MKKYLFIISICLIAFSLFFMQCCAKKKSKQEEPSVGKNEKVTLGQPPSAVMIEDTLIEEKAYPAPGVQNPAQLDSLKKELNNKKRR